MTDFTEIVFRRRPAAMASTLRTLLTRPFGDRSAEIPAIRAIWPQHRIDAAGLLKLQRLTGLREEEPLSLLYPQVFGFALNMAVLVHPAFPVPLWRALQVRNRWLLHRSFLEQPTVDLRTEVGAPRFLDRGTEVDLYTCVRAGGEPAWEGITTMYFRGWRRVPGASAPDPGPPPVHRTRIAHWRTPFGGGLDFARLTGDYNGIHYASPYARLLGFRRALMHPQWSLAQCLDRLPGLDRSGPRRLDAWIRGPVHYGCAVALHAETGEGGTEFALMTSQDPRPALLGRWSAGSPGRTLRGDGGGEVAAAGAAPAARS